MYVFLGFVLASGTEIKIQFLLLMYVTALLTCLSYYCYESSYVCNSVIPERKEKEKKCIK